MVLVTEWPEYRDLDLRSIAAVMRGNLFVDSRNVFHPDDVRAAGLRHDGFGRAGTRRQTSDLPMPQAVGGAGG